ncbi:MAG: radical SAM protein [Candidatus Thorarchaeota archaeon]|nr:MAG: radical SAM protein [Candidatus Thorarchaeota archaeon]
MPERVRLSLGTAIRLGLSKGKDDPYFTTAFFMTYHPSKCDANCAFCPQARESTSSADRLSRISWPDYRLHDVLAAWPKAPVFHRACIQSLVYEEVVNDVVGLARSIRGLTDIPLSLAIHPVARHEMVRLKEAGITTIGIALDAGNPEIFDEIKGIARGSGYHWDSHLNGLRSALEVFGQGNVTTHLIIGLGETEREAADFIFRMYDMGITVGLFAFTPIRGTKLENHPPPEIEVYRRIQVLRHLVHRGLLRKEDVSFDGEGRIQFEETREEVLRSIKTGLPFRVSGCKGCNRPYYNERPSGTMYNYPRPLRPDEVEEALNQMGLAR